MPIVSLSADFVRNVLCPEGKKKENYYDSSITGFILECRSTGGKTYAIRYRDSHIYMHLKWVKKFALLHYINIIQKVAEELSVQQPRLDRLCTVDFLPRLKSPCPAWQETI